MKTTEQLGHWNWHGKVILFRFFTTYQPSQSIITDIFIQFQLSKCSRSSSKLNVLQFLTLCTSNQFWIKRTFFYWEKVVSELNYFFKRVQKVVLTLAILVMSFQLYLDTKMQKERRVTNLKENSWIDIENSNFASRKLNQRFKNLFLSMLSSKSHPWKSHI